MSRLGVIAIALGIGLGGAIFAGNVFADRSETEERPTPIEASPSGIIRPHLGAVVQVVDVDDAGVGEVEAGEGGVWLALSSQREGVPFSIARIDPNSGAVTSRIPLDGPAIGLATGAGSLWVYGDVPGPEISALRIDPETNEIVATIPVGFEQGYGGPVAASDEAVWMWASTESGERVLVRIDPTTNEVLSRVRLGPPPDWGRFGDGEVAIAGGSVWVLDWNGDLLRVDPDANAITDQIRVGGFNMVTDGRILWVSVQPSGTERGVAHTGYLQRVDARSGALHGNPIPVEGGEPDPLDGGSGPLAVEGSNLWVRGYSGRYALITVARLDLVTLEVVDSIRVPLGVTSGAAFDLKHQAVWLSTVTGVLRVDLRSPELAEHERPDARCPAQPDGGFGLRFSTHAAQPGELVTISGNVPHYAKDGSYSRGSILQFWWNVDPRSWPHLTPGATTMPTAATDGPILLLGEANPGWACTFEIDVRMPDFPPGKYPLVPLQVGGGGAALLGDPIELEVMPSTE